MKKILIIGIVASGKTTLAKRLSKKINVPWYELDTIVHHQTPTGRYKRTAEEQIQVLKEIDKMKNGYLKEQTENLISAYIKWQIKSYSLILHCGSVD